MSSLFTPVQIGFLAGVYNYPYTPICIALNRVYSGFNTTYATSICTNQLVTTCQTDEQILYRCNSQLMNYTENRESEVQALLLSNSFLLYNQTTVDYVTPLTNFDGVVYAVMGTFTGFYLFGIVLILFADQLYDWCCCYKSKSQVIHIDDPNSAPL